MILLPGSSKKVAMRSNKKAVQYAPLLRTPSRARTADKLIKSQLLYQLS